jgi:hypothetical protein
MVRLGAAFQRAVTPRANEWGNTYLSHRVGPVHLMVTVMQQIAVLRARTRSRISQVNVLNWQPRANH